MFGDWGENSTYPNENTTYPEENTEENTEGSGDDELENKKRRKRSSSSTGCKTNTTSRSSNSSSKATKKKLVLKRTNSASSVLGLNVLLNPEIEEYEDGLTQNNYHGFKVTQIKYILINRELPTIHHMYIGYIARYNCS